MDLRVNTPVDNTGVKTDDKAPVVFVAVVEEGASLPEQKWATVKLFKRFPDLVTGQDASEGEIPVIVAVPDTDDLISKVRLVCDNVGTIGIRVVRVNDLTSYVPSPRAVSAFWGADQISWKDWALDAEEAARSANLAERSGLDADERRVEDARRKDGSIKPLSVVNSGGELPPPDDDLTMDKVSF